MLSTPPAEPGAEAVERRDRPVHAQPVALCALVADFGLEVVGSTSGIAVSGVSLSTRSVLPGDLFAALPGARRHGAAYAAEARSAGAVAILTDPAGVEDTAGLGLPVLVADDPRGLLGAIAATVNHTVDTPIRLFGVTGTNGKTTTVRLLEHLLALLGETTGSSSTIGRRIRHEEIAGGLTTPEAPDLHALLGRMRERDVTAAAIEVSAHAVRRHRIDGVRFTVAGFTNLTHDHLDEFRDMEDYFAAKAALFSPEHTRAGVVSLDTEYGERLARTATIPIVTIASGASASDPHWRVEVLHQGAETTGFALTGPRGERLETEVGLLGAHMAADAALAIVMLVTSGVPFTRIAEVVTGGIRMQVPGRIHRVMAPSGPAVFVDISHTPDAYEKTLLALRSRTAGRLVIVFGADGDRDPLKRPVMGRIAASLADVVYVTDHHSRFEDPDSIRSAVLEGARSVPGGAEVHDVPAPEDAIRDALAGLTERDTVLWAGTGLTRFREIRGELVPYSFHDDAVRALQELHSA